MNINYIETTFVETGKTPANGISYVCDDEDMCATVYGTFKKTARVYSNRKEGSDGFGKSPCYYEDMALLEE